jgi:Putative Flp pilus-assembly TadE/G-like
MALFVVLLAFVLVPMAAFVIDVAGAFALKRHLQASADAAALAGAGALAPVGPLEDGPRCTAWDYSATHFGNTGVPQPPDACTNYVGGMNARESYPHVKTLVEVDDVAGWVRVTETATSSVFFGWIVGFEGIEISADAQAERPDESPPVLVE